MKNRIAFAIIPRKSRQGGCFAWEKRRAYPFEKIKPLAEEILRIVIQDGKGIEFNTSYHRYGLRDTTPSADILKLYRELGGRIITVGSDSHSQKHLGAHIAEAKALLKELGFESFCTYDRMQPVFHRL